jgi:ABC-2 type transport system permease protein
LKKYTNSKRKGIHFEEGIRLMELLKYYHISKINFKNNFVYFKDSIASALFVSIIIFIFSNIWRVVFNTTQTELINGFTYPMMIWYLVLTESIILSQGKIIIEIGKEVISGEIANYLNKPYNYIFYKYASTIGASLFNFSLTFLIAGLTATLLVGPININLFNLPFILISCILGITLHFSMMATLGIFSLWMEDSRSLDFLYQKIIFVAGGMLAPLDIFPNWFANIALVLPFSYAVYSPAMLFINFSLERFVETISIQIFWIIFTIIIALVLFKFLLRRVSINGG